MYEKIEKVMKIFENSNLSKMEVEVDGFRISMEKGDTGAVKKVVESAPVENFEEKEEGTWITSPLVGTYYESKADGDEPFVKVGKEVKKGDVICIIEAMKVMNEITADRDGIVLKINPINKKMIQFGEKIILIGDKK